ncbi:hypothetical protein NC796_07595 [Aliifodinibius sp. S!AR15-10]|uniref:hypothetical protein n=1 Tax=Aliifodinibius sp. S!AR15-10 TaxID=2950437 RepID=UPI002864E31C|nr:hypothetical protein [Aliifodinibius sp. S!AR15-10]MDR8390995.1 hypothetical protein [Aliifodinibius sp. S!AR15-10]
MDNPIKILIKEVPENEHRFIKDTYVKLSPKEAYKLISEGYAVGYNSEWPFLSEEYPYRKILFEHGIYTEEQLKPRLGYAESIDGIGQKSVQEYKNLLFSNSPSKESDKEAISYDSKENEVQEN